jgi:hypothetical protein
MVNVHTRVLDAPPDALSPLLEGLGSPGDRLWPGSLWPPMRLDRGLEPGSRGGHGPIRYHVTRRVPGRLAEFEFDRWYEGSHRFEIEPAGPGRTLVRHVLEGTPKGIMRLGWPLAFRWLHDALVEDAFDKAQAAVEGTTWQPRGWPPYVRVLRRGVDALLRRGRG